MRSSATGRRAAIAVLLLAAAARAADVEVEASVDRSDVTLDATLELRVVATYAEQGATGELVLPDFKDFDIVGRSESDQTSFVFSGSAPSFRRTVSTTLTLAPRRAGDTLIEPVKLVSGTHTYATKALHVRVLAGGTPSSAVPPPPRGAEALGEVHPGKRDLFVRAVVDNDRPFVGQQVTYSLYLLTRNNVSSVQKQQMPRLDGFWAEDIEVPQQLNPEQRILDGVPFTTYLLLRRALFPLRPGKAVIEPAEVEVLTAYGLLFSRGNVKRRSDSIALDVQPLPAGRPAGFDAGNVGAWTLSATADPIAVPVGQPVTLRLRITGHGNVRDLKLPALPALAGVRAYAPTVAEEKGLDHGQVTGTRTLEQLLVPERTGSVEIPALAMDVFDPQAREYRSLRTEPLRITVAPASTAAVAAAAGGPQNVLGAGGLRPIRLRLSPASLHGALWSTPWFWLAFGAAPLGAVAVASAQWARRRLTRDPRAVREKRARPEARRRLDGARALLAKGDGAAFHAEVVRALSSYLEQRAGLRPAALTREELGRALLARGQSPETVRRLVRILDECDRARFSPGAADAREALLGRVDALITELETGSA